MSLNKQPVSANELTAEKPESFLVDLNSAWASDKTYWENVSTSLMDPANIKNLEPVRQELIEKLEALEKIITDGVEKSKDEISLAQMSVLEKLQRPLTFLKVKLEEISTMALRNQQNLLGVRYNLRYLLVQVVETQKACGIPTEGIPPNLDGDDVPGFQNHYRGVYKNFDPMYAD